MENNPSENSSGSKSKMLMTVITVILAIVIVALLIILLQTRSHLKGLLAEKEQQRVELRGELDSLMNEHEKVKMEYGELADTLISKDSVIQANAVEIKRLLDTEWEYYKVKKKLAQLQVVAQGYVRQMDSLYTVNAALTKENIEMKEDIRSLKKEKTEVEKNRDELSQKVEIASALKVYNVQAEAIRSRSGGDKEVATDKASKVDKIRVCFTVSENKIISAGDKDIFVRIARPDKEILTKTRGDEYTFEFQGAQLQYSIRKTIMYENRQEEICVYWDKQYSSQEMATGLYHVDIFCEGNEIGHTTFTLR